MSVTGCGLIMHFLNSRARGTAKETTRFPVQQWSNFISMEFLGLDLGCILNG